MADTTKTIDGFKVPAVPKRAPQPQFPPLNYEQPANAGAPPHDYTLDVIKAGCQVESHAVPTQKSFFTFGRLPICDFPMDHESISRYHAVLQFHNDGPPSIVDLGSSHGTYINKIQTAAKIPVQVRAGDQIRFGMSSRIWILNDPSEGAPGTEEPEQPVHRNAGPTKQGGKDPVAYLRKFLRKAVEKDEYTWTVSADDGGGLVSVDIAVELHDEDGNKLTGSAKAPTKDEAERLAALDLLAQLDGAGYLSQSKNRRNVAHPDDADNSDDDEYYDRTKSTDRESKHLELRQVETLESLTQKIHLVDTDIAAAKKQLLQMPELAENDDGELDELDMYINNINRDEQQQSRMRIAEQLERLETHRCKLLSLIKIVAPESSLLKEQGAADELSETESAEPSLSKVAVLDEPVAKAKSTEATSTEDKPMDAKTAKENSAEAKTTEDNSSNAKSAELSESPKEKRKRVYGPTREDIEHHSSTKQAKVDASVSGDGDATWQPPAGQTGDGWTSLNDKYGY
ncbi:hypothetical protein GGF43_002914 [Coemansia sp. RSA 2618]|nr:hypothetical protein GGF43_002914 [Coemansia sp. RSA 2618]